MFIGATSGALGGNANRRRMSRAVNNLPSKVDQALDNGRCQRYTSHFLMAHYFLNVPDLYTKKQVSDNECRKPQRQFVCSGDLTRSGCGHAQFLSFTLLD
jgi:hypothetical protein